MFRKYKWTMILSSIAIFVPSLIALLFWNKLPENMVTHIGTDGVPDGTSSRFFALFGIPAILLGFHWICILATNLDKKAWENNRKMVGLVLWLIPILSCFETALMVSVSLGKTFTLPFWISILFGILFMVIGNFLPKCRQSATLGIKIRHTLESEENWNATHRFAGKIWFFGGILIALCGFLPTKWMSVVYPVVFLAMILPPVIYSNLFYRKQKKEGTLKIQKPELYVKMPKWVRVLVVGIAIVLLIFVLFITFNGSVDFVAAENTLEVKADFYEDLSISYDKIDSVELVEDFNAGSRTMGFGSPKLSLGTFQNDAYGAYTLYGETGAKTAVLVVIDGEELVLAYRDSGKNEELLYSIKGKLDLEVKE